MSESLSPNLAYLKPSETVAISNETKRRRAAGEDIIDLSVGEPDFDTPKLVADAGIQAIQKGYTRYAANPGIVELRTAVARNLSLLSGGRAINPDQIIISNGSKQSIFNACFVLFGPGDEVLVPTPSWTSYYEIVQLARATPVAVYGRREHDLKVTVEDLERAATPRTRGLMLNSPTNPTGAVYSPQELGALLRLAHDRGWWVISDEIYRRICYDGVAASALHVAPSLDNLVLVDGVAKAYAMTGWRVGWSLAPVAVTRAMTALQSHATFHMASMAQYGALEALTRTADSEAAIAAMVGEYRARRDAALAVFETAPELPLIHPAGAFYFYFDVRAAFPGEPDAGTAFAKRLLEEQGVAVVPGAAFRTPEWVRASYAAPQEQVVEGVRRIVSLYRALTGR